MLRGRGREGGEETPIAKGAGKIPNAEGAGKRGDGGRGPMLRERGRDSTLRWRGKRLNTEGEGKRLSVEEAGKRLIATGTAYSTAMSIFKTDIPAKALRFSWTLSTMFTYLRSCAVVILYRVVLVRLS